MMMTPARALANAIDVKYGSIRRTGATEICNCVNHTGDGICDRSVDGQNVIVRR